MHVRSKEESFCPICGKLLSCIGSRLRHFINGLGTKSKFYIRRLRCPGCRKIHHEIPDCLIPYKRYSAKVIEKVISRGPGGGVAGYPCEESTEKRLKSWFWDRLDIFHNALESIKAVHNNNPDIDHVINSLLPLRRFSYFPDGWLKVLVRLLVNGARWQQTRFA